MARSRSRSVRRRLILTPAVLLLLALGFVLVTAAWALMTGGLMIGAAFKLNREHGRWWMLLGGIVSVIWGILLVLAPLMGAVMLTWWMGGYAIAFGALLLVLGFRLRGQTDAATPTGPATPRAA